MTTALTTLTGNLAKQFNMGDGSELASTLKQTCFKGDIQVSDAQMTALLVVAQQYGLNPFTREIFAFPDKGGIVPVVGVDGWARIINSHPQFDGMDFDQNENSCTCTIHRKDRGHPTAVTEYMVECARPNVKPWQTHPYRMLRHKSLIQCARMAFGFAGIYDQDEAERIVESVDASSGEITARKPAVAMPQAKQAAAPVVKAPQDERFTDVPVKEIRPPADDNLASVGEVAYILKKIQAKGVSIPEARNMGGLDAGDTLDGLTKDGFLSLKEALS